MQTIRVAASSANMGPGFDCMGIALNIFNEIDFELRPSGLTIELDECDRGVIPTDETNMIYRVFADVLAKHGAPVPGLYIRQRNDIPVMHGLGSSSACIVGGILMANEAMGNAMSFEEILDLAATTEGHPDNVLPVLLGGITVGAIHDGRVVHRRFDAPKGLRCAVFIPDFTLSTKKAREVLPKQVSMADAVFNMSHAALLAAGLAQGDITVMRDALRDRLHQDYRKSLIMGYDDVIALCERNGAMAACLSGAGPTLIAYLDGGEGFVEAVEPKLAAIPGGWQVRLVDVCTEGAHVQTCANVRRR